VREPVPTYFGANQFTIDSDFGVFEASGNEMLLRRINEINAIAQLKDVSRTDEYKNALVAAAKSPVAAVKNIANDPVNTISNVPKGIMKFMSRAGESVKNIGKKNESTKAEGSKVQQLIGFSDTKQKLAIKLGIDPYSTNTELQHELDGVAWASFAGGATFSLATLPIGGGAGAALTVTDVTNSFDEMLREKSPTDLKIMNRKTLLALGANAKETERFLNNTAFSPSAQTAFVLNLRSLSGVANRGAFVRTAGETSSDEQDAIFCVQMGLRRLDVRRGRLYKRCAKTRRRIWQKQKCFCRGFRASFTAIATGIGSARFHGARSACARPAEVICASGLDGCKSSSERLFCGTAVIPPTGA
jgi:hypothetical protein